MSVPGPIIAVAWKQATGLRCVLAATEDRWHVRVENGTQTIRSQITLDVASAVTLSDEWRAEFERRVNK